MAEFHTEVFQNEFLPDGGTDLHAIVRVTSTGASAAGAGSRSTDPGSSAEVILIDTSKSCGTPDDYQDSEVKERADQLGLDWSRLARPKIEATQRHIDDIVQP